MVSLILAGVTVASLATMDECKSIAAERAAKYAIGAREGVYAVTVAGTTWTVKKDGTPVYTAECR